LYGALQDELRDEFEQHGTVIQVVRLYSEATITTVAVTIGVGVAVHLLSKLIDRLIKVREGETKKQTQITVNVSITNNAYNLPEEKNRLLDDYSKITEGSKTGNDDT